MTWGAESQTVRPIESDGLVERRRRFLGCPIDLLTMQETLDVIENAINHRNARPQAFLHVVINVAKLVACRRNPALRDDLESADLVNVDGMGVVWGARLCGIPVPERVTGIDLMDALLALASAKGYRAYFLGARQEVLERAVAEMRRRYRGLQIAGYHHGYYGSQEEASVVALIAATHADMLFVALPTPTKERFTMRNAHLLGVPFIMGIGGSIDVIGGLVRRAPMSLQAAGLEWAYRLVQEPWRLGRRYLVTNTVFLGLLIGALSRRVIGKPAGFARDSKQT
jgi:N-acetylglucosaminyldiphosphoundecaprenol N-acetyl-beta-D-mannosaminyltransferase